MSNLVNGAIKDVNTNPFAMASMKRYRFNVKNRGTLTTEDLWALNPEELNSIYQELDIQLNKPGQARSLLDDPKVDTDTEMKMLIVSTIFSYKRAVSQREVEERDKDAYLQRVAAILDNKRNQELENLSTKELEAILKNGGPINTTSDDPDPTDSRH